MKILEELFLYRMDYEFLIKVLVRSVLAVIIGALIWLTIGLFGFDCVGALFGGQMAILSRIVYTLVGLAGLWCITLLFNRDEHHAHQR